MPLLDEQQSYTLLSLKESDGQTTMTFQRTIKSCDEQDFHITVRKSDSDSTTQVVGAQEPILAVLR